MTISDFNQLFAAPKPFIAMIHVPALPGTPAYSRTDILAQVAAEARLYYELGADGLLLENMHDAPYLRRQVGPEIIAWMTAAAVRVRREVPQLSCGIQILAGANQAALAVAQAADLQFIRAEAFVYGHVADEGWMDGDAGELLRYRKQIDASQIAVFTDIKKKHSAHAATADVSLAETAHAAAFFRADGLIVTGSATGKAAAPADAQAVKDACPELPLLIGSGISPDNLAEFMPYADGFIVGSFLKAQGHWANAPDPDRISSFVTQLQLARTSYRSPSQDS